MHFMCKLNLINVKNAYLHQVFFVSSKVTFHFIVKVNKKKLDLPLI